jgi:hypothetical protein
VCEVRVKRSKAEAHQAITGLDRKTQVWLRMYAVIVFVAVAVAVGDLALAWHATWLQTWAQRGSPHMWRQLAGFFLTGA